MNQNLCNKKEKYLLALNVISNKINSFIDILNRCEVEDGDSIEVIILKKYIELYDTTKVAEYMNECGYRIATNSSIGRRKYNHNDVSKIVNNEEAGAGTHLYGAVHTMKELEKKIKKINILKIKK